MSFAVFKKYTQIGQSTFSDQIQSNLVSMLDYGLLCMGGFFTARTGVNAYYGNSHSNLRLSDDPRYMKGRVWESARSNWVWESNIEYNIQPISISGIYVNGSFLPNGSGYYIDYPRGRVVFNSSIPVTSQVKAEYSYRYYNVYSANVMWFRELMNNSFRVDDHQFNQYGSGVWSLLSDNRAQLPCIFPYLVPRYNWKPKQLGGGEYLYHDVIFYIFAETPTDRDRIIDILSVQEEKRIFFYDKNLVAANNYYPLDVNGSLKPSGARNFVDLVENCLWADAIITKTTMIDKNDYDAPNLFRGSCQWRLWIDFPDV